ncbi:hypothetical protein N579_04435 [Corynebacterium pseudodiphtheriticum 090104]|nr:hypothetical protein N579_04435 [Corynebacterium pseudodiphtheriticum 090104]
MIHIFMALVWLFGVIHNDSASLAVVSLANLNPMRNSVSWIPEMSFDWMSSEIRECYD